MDGVLLVDKSQGPSSFDVVRKVRRAFKMKKVGHAGTLDPMATGLLVVCMGKYTRLVPYMMDSPKKYVATIQFGAETTTDDAMGEVIKKMPVPALSSNDVVSIQPVLQGFVGRISQVPPVYSALKQHGEAAYKKARRGEQVEMRAREVEVYSIGLTRIGDSSLDIEVSCGKGTYIRSLARDIARKLNTVGHLSALRRIETSGFSVTEAVSFEKIDQLTDTGELMSFVMDGSTALRTFTKIQLSDADGLLVKDGRPVNAAHYAHGIQCGESVCLINSHGGLMALAILQENGMLKMAKVFAAQ